ncbi:MAG: hypothetical protein GVY13_12710 [Alphaproteobacteria bacterium]|jgi:hypothetical protein|nr:hypothetical protein [Alphaproteobacteria bacterium]
MPSSNTESFGTELIRTMLAHAPRPADGEITTILIALHDMVEAWSRAARPDDEQPLHDLVSPLYALLEDYRPTTLAGVEAMIEFTIREVEQDALARAQLGTLRVLLSSVRDLARLEADRHHSDAIPLLRLSSPRGHR